MPDSEFSAVASPANFTVRHDPVHGWPVMYAPPRALRPFDFNGKKPLVCSTDDPVLEGREDITTPETLAIRPPNSPADGPGWQVRIIPNKFPALAPFGQYAAIRGAAAADESGQGVHEVIIECPHAETHFTRLSSEHRCLVLRAIRDRFRQLAQHPTVKHATLFKNHGPSAGASLTHSHCQLIATQFVPPQVQRELDYCQQQHASFGADYYDELIAAELACGTRLVEVTDDFVLACPSVSRFGFEMHLWPRVAQPHFNNIDDALLRKLTGVLSRALQRLEQVAADPDYNLVLHTAPFPPAISPGFRWHWEIYPRIAGIAGWELGAGGFVNPLYPETAAQRLRDILFD